VNVAMRVTVDIVREILATVSFWSMIRTRLGLLSRIINFKYIKLIGINLVDMDRLAGY